MDKQTYEVQVLEGSIHLEPKKKLSAPEQGRTGKPRKLCQKADVYQWENDKIDVLFKGKGEKLQAPTLTMVTSFPFLRILQSKNRFNLVFCFGKEEVKLFEREMLYNKEFWVEAMYAAIENQKNGGTQEELEKRISEIKRKGDFV